MSPVDAKHRVSTSGGEIAYTDDGDGPPVRPDPRLPAVRVRLARPGSAAVLAVPRDRSRHAGLGRLGPPGRSAARSRRAGRVPRRARAGARHRAVRGDRPLGGRGRRAAPRPGPPGRRRDGADVEHRVRRVAHAAHARDPAHARGPGGGAVRALGHAGVAADRHGRPRSPDAGSGGGVPAAVVRPRRGRVVLPVRARDGRHGVGGPRRRPAEARDPRPHLLGRGGRVLPARRRGAAERRPSRRRRSACSRDAATSWWRTRSRRSAR